MYHRDEVMTAHLPGRQPGSDLAPATPPEPVTTEFDGP